MEEIIKKLALEVDSDIAEVMLKDSTRPHSQENRMWKNYELINDPVHNMICWQQVREMVKMRQESNLHELLDEEEL